MKLKNAKWFLQPSSNTPIKVRYIFKETDIDDFCLKIQPNKFHPIADFEVSNGRFFCALRVSFYE